MDGPVKQGDIVQSRKPHPCGSDLWAVLRTGSDVRLRCEGCGRVVLLDMNTFLRSRKKTVSRAVPETAGESCH